MQPIKVTTTKMVEIHLSPCMIAIAQYRSRSCSSCAVTSSLHNWGTMECTILVDFVIGCYRHGLDSFNNHNVFELLRDRVALWRLPSACR